MRPWSCTQSWMIEGQRSEMYDFATLTSSAASSSSACTARALAVAVAWHPSSHVRMSANRCFNAWYEPIGRPNAMRSFAYSNVKLKTTSVAPTVSASCNTNATWSWHSTSAAAPPTSPTTASVDNDARSNATDPNWRVKSSVP